MISSILGREPVVMLVINPAVDCNYFLPGLWLPSQLQSVTTLSGTLYCLLYRGTCVNDLLRVTAWQWNNEGSSKQFLDH